MKQMLEYTPLMSLQSPFCPAPDGILCRKTPKTSRNWELAEALLER